MNLYITADNFTNTPKTGGENVVHHEIDALSNWNSKFYTRICTKKELQGGSDPWNWDKVCVKLLKEEYEDTEEPSNIEKPRLAHGYAGSFTQTIKLLKSWGTKVCWTVAAHDVEISKQEHESSGIHGRRFDYPHLTDKKLFEQYIEGYKLCDVLVAPGTAPLNTMRKQGINTRIEIIPHGVDIPKETTPLPKSFRVGYLGCNTGPDKGLKYLLQAWKQLNYKDAVLVLGGGDSTSAACFEMVREYAGNSRVVHLGWVESVSDFYSSISLFVCPAATEGFNLECLEAMAHQRPVLCSEGAGVADLIPESWKFPARDAFSLASKIEFFRSVPHLWSTMALWNRKKAEENSWTNIKKRYQDLWKSLL